MTFCISCSAWSHEVLCAECRNHLRPSSPMQCGGIAVACGLVHETVARHLVHVLKYKAVDSAALVLGSIMASQLQNGATALVPVPRALVRRLRYGVDPALVLAQRMRALTGLELVPALAAPIWWPSHAGSDRASRHPPRFRLVRSAPAGSVLIDDVVTTGATLRAAAELTGAVKAITATRAETPRYE
jgi:predicted amidophosphoribosyltransferase